MSDWKKLSEVVSRGEVREFLDSLKGFPQITQLAYAIALTIVQLKVDERLNTISFFYALCLYFEQNCEECLAYRDRSCLISNPDIADPIRFAKKLYSIIAKSVPREYIEDGNK